MSDLNPSLQAFLARPKVTPILVFLGLLVALWLIQEEFNPGSTGELLVPFAKWQESLKRLGLASATIATALLIVSPRRRNIFELILLFGLLVTLSVCLLKFGNNVAKALLVVPIVARFYLDLRWNVVLLFFGVLANGIYILYLFMLNPTDQYNMVYYTQYHAVLLSEIVFIFVAFEAVVSNEMRGRALDEALRELKDSRAAQLVGAAVAERSALSRELHDTMGHELAALRLEVQRARKLEQKSAAPTPEVIAALDSAMLRSATALEQLQEVVSTLRTPELDGTLYQAIEDLLVTWPGQATLHLHGTEPALPMPTKLTLYRAVQESLTNAQKYAPNQPVSVNISSIEGELRLNITNSKPRVVLTPSSSRRSGTGLNSLRDRIADLGGTLESRNLEDEFSVCLKIPIPRQS